MVDSTKLTRRHVLTGKLGNFHIASAIISVLPARQDAVARQVSVIPGVEVRQQAPSKIIIVLEGTDSGEIGSKLIEIAGMEGVLAANLVFEHVEPAQEPGEHG